MMMMMMIRLRTALFAVTTLAYSQQVNSFSYEAHYAIGNLAWDRLTEEAQQSVREIMERSADFYNSLVVADCTEECSPLAEYAKWADDVRDDRTTSKIYGYTYPYHYIEIPDLEVSCPILEDDVENQCWFDYDRDCKNDDCSVAVVTKFASELMEGNATMENLFFEEESGWFSGWFFPQELAADRRLYGDPMRESLMFLVHLIGDVHTPLHNAYASDFGGDWTPVTFFDSTVARKPKWWFLGLFCQFPPISWLAGGNCGRHMFLVSLDVYIPS